MSGLKLKLKKKPTYQNVPLPKQTSLYIKETKLVESLLYYTKS